MNEVEIACLLQIALPAGVRLDVQKVNLLEAIDRCGSITSAAKDRKVSYRYAWLLVDELNRAFRLPVIDTTFGGRNGGETKLTETGRAVIDLYRLLNRKADAAIAPELAELSALSAAGGQPPERGHAHSRDGQASLES